MADGSWHRTAARAGGPTRLGQAAAGRATLWARCGCGQEAVLDPAPWLGQGLARHPLAELEERLRCRCGARSAHLEIRGLAEAPPSAAGGIFIFR
jgi:hypothetical protein